MQVTRYPLANNFLAAAESYLMQHEVIHNTLIGVAQRGVENGTLTENDYFATVTSDNDGEVIAVAMCTPPFQLQLSEVTSSEALDALMDDIMAFYGESLTGVAGKRENAEYFAQQWQEKTGMTYAEKMGQGIYKLTTVILPRPVNGYYRTMDVNDRELFMRWHVGFDRDTGLNQLTDEIAKQVADNYLDDNPKRTVWVWLDEIDGEETPVAMTGSGRHTPNGSSVSLVYTPPELRGRGYASNLVAKVSQQILDNGKQFCFLFTDLANPTSNKIYQAIGYEHVADIMLYDFTAERG